MTTESFDFLVFIGRFQPFHNGHLDVLNQALQCGERVIVLVGSAHQPRSFRNPFSFTEREAMIRSSLDKSVQDRVIIAPLLDVPYNDELWCRNVQQTVAGAIASYHTQTHRDARIALIGQNKDKSSYYLKLFPQWESVSATGSPLLNATDLREGLFGDGELEQQSVPASVARELEAFRATDEFQSLAQEYAYILDYHKQWSSAPFPPVFTTVDAVVVQSGHVLMVRRRVPPGKGLIALPGGFIDQTETLESACLRELREETRIKVPEPVLRGSIQKRQVFDYPYRSARGRTITTAFLIELAPSDNLPKVRGGDDAERAFWIPLAQIKPEHCFEDHYAILQELLLGGA